ncbi:hypothetical protein EL17_23265 [Anditalea andensis]|uniref:DUF1493 family protein n=2 Tax=Anditalea andensis TaxID=1048983 RepID=A0A074KTV9_9BACT|nr:hypothetical protein EL17_23265 [Anditalea andensis]
MSGDDAGEFIQDFARSFNVDLSEFNFDNYFANEGFNLFSFIYSIIGGDYQPITIGDLEKSAKNGKWIKGR